MSRKIAERGSFDDGCSDPDVHRNSGQDLNAMTSSSSSCKTKKPRKARTAFTDHQLSCLEKSFERQKYLSVQDRMELAAKLSHRHTGQDLVPEQESGPGHPYVNRSPPPGAACPVWESAGECLLVCRLPSQLSATPRAARREGLGAAL
ncbi:hypothetical protein C0Q70_17996 [Pomacea canaliculata]|uniref:Homeobox domain-containing protein n=1 Tax=Pomacea canaliculata TaxID=400727 RepID=A0A2T7NM04_POMCA|nr:hypothetical protein C0Q70_17996 [Pomacea canaliculata]